MIFTFAYLMIVLGMIFVGIWLWIGIETYHCFWYAGPLAAAGYEGNVDNLFKCSILFVWVIFWLGPDIEYIHFFTMVIGVAFIGLLRGLLVWRS